MSTEADATMKVLYVKGGSVDVDESTLQQLRTQAPELDVTVVVSSAAALAEVRRSAGWHAVLVSPSLPQNETLAIIASLRRDRVPIAIVPIVDDAHQDVFAAAVASGADDVLMRRGQALVSVSETLTRIRQSPHLFPAEQRRRLTVLYAGRDPLVWNLLEQVPFVDAERVTIGLDGSCPVRAPGVTDGSLRCDAVVVDEQPGDAHPLQVLKSVKAQASDLPVIMLTSTGASDIATAALELGADDTVVKTGIFRRRLIATLRRVHMRLELTSQQAETKAREERLRLIVETVPTGITVIAADGVVLAMNAAALRVFGAAKPREVVGRDLRQLVATDHHDAVADFVHRVTRGESTSVTFTAAGLDGRTATVQLQGVMLERDARGGRGVVASVSLEHGAMPLGGVSTTGELAELRDAIPRLEQQQAEIAQMRERERVEWEHERAAFEARLEAAERAAAEQQARGERLEALSSELGAAREAFEAERAQLDARLQEAMASGEAAERDWQAARSALETQLREIADQGASHAEQAAALPAVRAQIDATHATLEAERAEARTRLTQLEHELRQAREALWTEHGQRDEERARFESELKAVRDALSTERADWEQHRAALASERDEARERAGAHERTLAAAQVEQDAIRTRLESETRAGDERHAGLESEVAQLRSALEGARTEAERAVERAAAAERELSGLRQALVDRGQESEQIRQRTETELAALRDQLADAQRQHESHLTSHAADLQQAADRTASAERDLESARQQLARQREEAEQTTRQLQSEIEGARRAVDGAGDDRTARIAELEAVLRDTTARADQLQSELDAVRGATAETESLIAGHTAERQDWHDTRARLEADLAAARAAHDAGRQIWDSLRAGLEDDLHRTREQLSSAQGDWESSRAALDEERQQALARAHTSERERDSLRADLDDARRRSAESQTAAEQAWQHERGVLETALQQARERLEQVDGEHQSKQAELAAALEAERQASGDLRGRLEAERDAALEQLRIRQQEWDAHRASFEGLLRHAHNDVESLQRELDATQAQLERDREDVRNATDRERSEWEAAREAAERETEALRATVSALEQDLASQVTQLSSALQAAEARAGTADSVQGALDAARAEIRHTDEQHAAERAEWASARTALEAARADAVNQLDLERQTWSQERAAIDARIRDVDALRSQHQQLEDSLNALRTDYAAMVQALAIEREGRSEDRRVLEALRAVVAEHEAARASLQRELTDAAEQTRAHAAARELEHAARLRALEEDLASAADRLARVTDDADRARAALQTEYLRASESHTRLIASDMFAYAVTTLPGELVRCNDAFAKLLGYADAPDVLTRTAGRLLPAFAGRDQVTTRLLASGHVDRLESCLERVDGQAVRILESAALLAEGDQPEDETLVEHVIIGAVAGADREERRARGLEEVGALTSAMIPEIETLASTAHERGHDLRRQLREGGAADVDGILALTSNINALVRQLATFSRRHLRDTDAIDLADAIARTEPVLVRLVGDFITFSMHLSPAPPVIVDADDLDQLLTSLVTFGRDLLPAGGSLTVEVLPPGTAGSTLLAVTASGYGLHLPADAPALELVARRCGATLALGGEPGWLARLEVRFPRCGGPQRSGWTWSTD